MKNKTYHIITIGCQMNKVDSERLAAFLESENYRLEADFKKAGTIIINTCGIRQMAEDRVYGLVNEIRKFNPAAKIVIAGCLSKRADVKKRLAGRADIFLPISEMSRLPELLSGEEFQPHFSLDEVRLEQGEKYLDIAPKHESKFTAYIPIGNGCNNFCSYCVVPYARGREVYRGAAGILKETRTLIKNGYKEIVLIAQNVNSYHDAKVKFPELLEKIIKIPGNFWIRFSSSHPKDMSADLIRVISSSPKVCPHLHMAVQSGDDKILKAMNRGYTAKHYQDLIKKVRAAKPDIAITTDVIVGFPGETRAQFLNTVKLFKAVKFDLAYISKYSPRPGTVSYQMKNDVSAAEKKRRASEINETLKVTAARNNQGHLGEIMEVLVEGKNRKGKYYGKTGSYQTVLIAVGKTANPGSLVGNFVKVRISKARAFGLEGKIKTKNPGKSLPSAKPKVLVILGTTSAGKTSLGVKLAARLGGEIISADSRQVYKGLDIGTGKDLAEYKSGRKNISYHLIDVASPKTQFDLAKYQKLSFQAIDDILRRGKLPIIVGGSGLYLQALVDNYNLAGVRPPSANRKNREKLSAARLFALIAKKKPDFAARLNNSDRNNARRLVRYLEIIAAGGLEKVGRRESSYDFLLLGLNLPNALLRTRIVGRLLDRLEKEGLVAEVKHLNEQGVSWERLQSFGLEYRFVSRHLLGELSYQEMVEKLSIALYRFAKRQKTWFRRWEKQGAKIYWVKDLMAAEKKIKRWAPDLLK